MPDSALYLYCVVPAPAAPPPLRAAALNGAAVHAVRYQDLAVLTHACRPEPYQGSAEDVRGWVAAHNAVVEEAWAAAGSALPMSFDVIVSGGHGRSAEANLTCWLGEHHAAIRDRLQALDGRAEVGVQVLWAAGGRPRRGGRMRQAPPAAANSSLVSNSNGWPGKSSSIRSARTAAATSGTLPRWRTKFMSTG